MVSNFRAISQTIHGHPWQQGVVPLPVGACDGFGVDISHFCAIEIPTVWYDFSVFACIPVTCRHAHLPLENGCFQHLTMWNAIFSAAACRKAVGNSFAKPTRVRGEAVSDVARARSIRRGAWATVPGRAGLRCVATALNDDHGQQGLNGLRSAGEGAARRKRVPSEAAWILWCELPHGAYSQGLCIACHDRVVWHEVAVPPSQCASRHAIIRAALTVGNR